MGPGFKVFKHLLNQIFPPKQFYTALGAKIKAMPDFPQGTVSNCLGVAVPGAEAALGGAYAGFCIDDSRDQSSGQVIFEITNKWKMLLGVKS